MKNILILLIFLAFLSTKAFAQSSTFEKTVTVSITKRVELLDVDNQPLKAGRLYRIKLSTINTGTRTGAEYLVWYSNPEIQWKLRAVTSNGNGVGSNHPQLEVDGNVVKLYTNHASDYAIKVYAEVFSAGNGYTIPSVFGPSYQWQRLANNIYYTDGNVGIRTATPKEALSVNGNIRAHQVKVETNNWPDYVFNEDYDLPSLKSTADFIKENKHLPGVPKAAEVERDGVSLGEMNKILLQKIEELTLHLIEKDTRLEKVEKRLGELEAVIK